jgi:hypothetical protein
MKRWLRSTLLVLLLLFSFRKAEAQMIVHTDESGFTYNWQLSNQTCYGCGSIYVSVWSDYKLNNKGYYTFYVYFWSNSFYANGYAANSYVSNININFINNGLSTHILGPYYIVAVPKSANFDGYNVAAILYSKNPRQIINITWGGVVAY